MIALFFTKKERVKHEVIPLLPQINQNRLQTIQTKEFCQKSLDHFF